MFLGISRIKIEASKGVLLEFRLAEKGFLRLQACTGCIVAELAYTCPVFNLMLTKGEFCKCPLLALK